MLYYYLDFTNIVLKASHAAKRTQGWERKKGLATLKAPFYDRPRADTSDRAVSQHWTLSHQVLTDPI